MSDTHDPSRYLSKTRITPEPMPSDLTVEQLVERFHKSGAYNAGRLAEACKLYETMLNEDATIGLTIAGAMIPTGIGGPFISLMEHGLIDFIISTGANLYHDLHFALDLPVHQGDFRADDVELLDHGVVRIYDIFITEQLLLRTDKYLQEIFLSKKPDKPISTAELHRWIGDALLANAKYPERSFVAQAAKYDVPIYTSSPGDSSIGMNLAATKLMGGIVTVDPDLDVLETAAIVLSSRKNGVIILGGGSPKNFYLQTQPTLSQILGINRGGHDYVIQVTTDAPHWGGLSGATPSEAISWGKINPKEIRNNVVVYSDSTIAAPILFEYALTKKQRKPLKRVYNRRSEFMDNLVKEFVKKRNAAKL